MAGQVKVAEFGDISRFRDDFPILKRDVHGRRTVYLDSAASAQKPQIVIDTMRKVYEEHYANIHRGLYSFSHQTTTAFERAREKISDFLNAYSDREVVFTRNATEGINLVAQSWGRANLKAGDEIILSEMEHHANIVPWQLLRDEIGFTIRVIPVRDDGSLDMDVYKDLLSEKTRLVSIVHISNSLGTINPVNEINVVAKKFNPEIKVLVDGSQAVVHSHVNIRAIGCDFYVFTGHKLYGPSGIGVLWGREDILNEMPPYQGGGDMIDQVTFENTTYKPAPSRFEAGTPAIVEAIGLGAAIDYIERVGIHDIEHHEQELLVYAQEKLDHVPGLTLYGTAPEKAAILSFTADWGHPSDIGTILDQTGVAVRAGHHCCQPLMRRCGVDATVRASLGLYSSRDDIDALVAGLNTARGLLA